MFNEYHYSDDIIDKRIENTCGCYRTKEEAIAKVKEMLGIYTIDGVEYRRGEMVEVSNQGWEIWITRKFLGFFNDRVVCETEQVSCLVVVVPATAVTGTLLFTELSFVNIATVDRLFLSPEYIWSVTCSTLFITTVGALYPAGFSLLSGCSTLTGF